MKDLSYWLRKKPQPVAILADERRIEVGKGARVWNELTNTIKAMEPAKLTCLDGTGNVIRVVTLDSDDEKTAPSIEMSDVQLFAKLLAEAYREGRNGNQPIVDSAMQFVERQAARLAKAESEIERLRGVIHKLNGQLLELSHAPVAEASGDESVLGTIVSGFLQGQQAAALQAQTQQTGQQQAVTPPINGAGQQKGAAKPK